MTVVRDDDSVTLSFPPEMETRLLFVFFRGGGGGHVEKK